MRARTTKEAEAAYSSVGRCSSEPIMDLIALRAVSSAQRSWSGASATAGRTSCEWMDFIVASPSFFSEAFESARANLSWTHSRVVQCVFASASGSEDELCLLLLLLHCIALHCVFWILGEMYQLS